MTLKTFAPNGLDTVQLNAGTTSARVALDPSSTAVRVVNAGPSLAYIHFGDNNVAANNAKLPLPVGATELFTKARCTHVAAVCDSGTAVLYFTGGEGL